VFRVDSRPIFLICVDQRNLRPLQSFPLNKVNPPLNFIRFFKTLRFFVALTFAARLYRETDRASAVTPTQP